MFAYFFFFCKYIISNTAIVLYFYIYIHKCFEILFIQISFVPFSYIICLYVYCILLSQDFSCIITFCILISSSCNILYHGFYRETYMNKFIHLPCVLLPYKHGLFNMYFFLSPQGCSSKTHYKLLAMYVFITNLYKIIASNSLMVLHFTLFIHLFIPCS